jgi:hypothetical protein
MTKVLVRKYGYHERYPKRYVKRFVSILVIDRMFNSAFGDFDIPEHL